MPELPEVETLRRSLLPLALDQPVTAVHDRFPGYTRTHPDAPPDALVGQPITRLKRHGKQLALLTGPDAAGPCLLIHLGMSGRFTFHPSSGRPGVAIGSQERHDHLVLQLPAGRLILHDPRRFGGAWVYPSFALMRAERWSSLGPDALNLDQPEHAQAMIRSLKRTKRYLKAALLDQTVVAGLGNIYVDELLFRAGLSPILRAHRLTRAQAWQIAELAPPLLREAIQAGGSSLRDYTDARSQPGGFQLQHQVYGRAGQICPACGEILVQGLVAARATVACPQCQGVRPRSLQRAR
ncbi:MAG: bifunctional DNA-formamidopyrimidine glycosylase/DNA-(apurinic or apyrimidinic site) lyase [Planctomycetota bacterium]